MLSILILLSIILLLISYIIYSKRKFNYWKTRKVNYVKPLPIFGNLLSMFLHKKTFGEWLADICRQFNEDYFGIYILDQPVLVVESPRLIKNILQKDFNYFQNRSATGSKHDPILSNILFFSDNPKWKASRTKLTPVFSSGKLKLMFNLILNESIEMVDYISRIVNTNDVESKEICAKYSTNVIAKCAFAVDARSFQSENAEFRNLGRRIFDFRYSTSIRQLSAWLAPNLVHKFNISFIDPYVKDRLIAIFTEVLQERMSSDSLHNVNDLVDIMLGAQSMDKDVLVSHALQFFLAGFETVSSTLSFALYELCIHPEIQTKLRHEILENIEKNNGLTYEGVMEMKYLDMCVSETLRKYPALPFLDRTCIKDYRLNENLTIEKDMPVYIPLFGLHYNPEFYPEPCKYDPERFKDKTKINVDNLTYIPFGEGPRNCIGNRFGLMGVKIGLIGILQNFLLEKSPKTPETLKFESKSILLQSNVGLPLKFVPI